MTYRLSSKAPGVRNSSRSPRRRLPRRQFPRRQFLIGGASLLLLGAAGCGGGSGGGEETTEASARTVEHKYGSTEIEGTPERVVSVAYGDQDAALALGVSPVAILEWYADEPYASLPWIPESFEGAESVGGETGTINFEVVAAARPDVILGASSGMTEEDYETLREIAPTVAQSGEYIDFGVPWQEQARTVGLALGREEQARELVADVERRFTQAREANPAFEGASGVVANPGPDGSYYVFASRDGRGRVLEQLGFRVPEEIASLAEDQFYALISGERLDLLDTDVLLWLVTPDQRAALEENEVYNRLAVAREGRDVYLDSYGPLGGALSSASALNLPYVLDELVPRLAAAIDGDPETEPERDESL